MLRRMPTMPVPTDQPARTTAEVVGILEQNDARAKLRMTVIRGDPPGIERVPGPTPNAVSQVVTFPPEIFIAFSTLV